MSDIKCNYQKIVSIEEFSKALSEMICQHCGITTRELIARGQLLQVCAEEFSSDITSGERVMQTVALCPECHRQHHLDEHNCHNPCHVKARLSREGLD